MPRATAVFLTISASPCRASSAKPSGMQSLIGQRSRPPGSDECSQMRIEFTTIGIDIQAISTAIGIRKKMPPNTSTHAWVRGDIRL